MIQFKQNYLLLIFSIFIAGSMTFAGSLDSSAAQDIYSSYTLTDIYNRLNSGTSGSGSVFTEPAAGPTSGTGYTLNQIMGVAPSLDSTNSAVAEDVVAGKTFWGLSSGEWGPLTGSKAEKVLLPVTGQTTCYATGDDGDYEKGLIDPSPRFTDNGDGTVTDNRTDLIWLKDANDFGACPWATALSYCNALSSGSNGLTDGSSAGDWRLPNRFELESIIDLGQAAPALPAGHPFSNVQTYHYYWSSSSSALDSGLSWCIGMGNGMVNSLNKIVSYYVLPVRDKRDGE